MTGAELADALTASRAKALATLGKAYVRRADEPDDELFAGIMRGMGLDDDVAVEFLLTAWKVQRDDS